MLIDQRIINLERNQEQYFLSQSTNSHLMMSDELIYMEDCVLNLVNSMKFNQFLTTNNIKHNKTFEVHLYFFQTNLRLFFVQLAYNRQLFKKKKKTTLFHTKQNNCNCKHLYNNQCICLKSNYFHNYDEKEVQSLLVVLLFYIIHCWKNKEKVGIDIFEINYQPTLRILQCGYEI